MRSKTSSVLPLKNRLSVKLAFLFANTFLLVFLGGFVYDIFVSQAENLLLNDATVSQPPVTAIDPKLEGDLVKVLDFENLPDTADIKDPFTDSGGISDNAKVVAGSVTPPDSTTTSTNKSVVATSTQKNPIQQNIPGNKVGQNNYINIPMPEVDTKMRIQMRDERIRSGQDGGSESSVFAIDDLLPVGVVSGGDGAEEIMFYSAAADQTFSFPVGTRFYDGWLVELRPEGVVFGFSDQYHTMRLKSWGRSIRTKNSERVSVNGLPDQITETGGSN